MHAGSLCQALRWLDFHVRTHPRLTALALWLVAVYLHPALGVSAPLLIGIVQLDDVNTVTTKDIMPGVADNFFRAGPITAYCKSRFTRKWVGPQVQENYLDCRGRR